MLRQAQRQYPGDLWINHLLAWLCLNALRPPQLDDAARFFSAALAVRPRSYYLTTGLGIALARKGSYQEAIAEFDKAIELKPDRALQWYCRGLTYTFIEEWKKALADFSMAIKLDPKYGAAWNYRGQVHAKLGQWDEAAADFGRDLELDPGDHWTWYWSAALRLKGGDVAGYRRACREMLARFGNTEDPAIAERTAKTCSLAPNAVSNFEPVLQLANRALEKNGSDRWVLLSKGLAEYRAGHPAGTTKCLKRVSPKADGEHLDATAFAVLAMAQHGLGRDEEARAAVQSAQAILAEKMPVPGKGRPFGGDWHDWLRARILTREAHALLSIKDEITHHKNTKNKEKP